MDVGSEQVVRLEVMRPLLGRDMEWVGSTEVLRVHQEHDSEHPDSCQDRERMKIEEVESNHLPVQGSHLAGREVVVVVVVEEVLKD